MTRWGIVLAAGAGVRFGARKQLALLAGRRLVDRAVDLLTGACDGVVVVLPADVSWDGPPVAAAVAGGATRAASVRAGLAAVPADAMVVVIHDAAHPVAREAVLTAAIEAVDAGADAAVPGVRPADVVKHVAAGDVTATTPTTGIVLAQMPMAFSATALRAAHAGAPEAAEDSELVALAGGRVAVVPGDPRNVHVVDGASWRVAQLWAGEPAGVAP